MERYIYVDRISDLYNKHYKLIGRGSEGSAYLIDNQKVLKVNDGKNFILKSAKEKDKIIMRQDIDLESFFFPETLYICNGQIVGYLSKYFGKDILNINNDYLVDDSEIKKSFPNLTSIWNARDKMIDDLKVLSKNNIELWDACFNILFDGHKFGAIDTLGYRKNNGITLDKNIEYLDYAILNELKIKYNDFFDIDENETFKDNVRRLKKSLKEYL